MKKGFKKTVSLLLSSLVLASAISFSAGAAQIKTDDAVGYGNQSFLETYATAAYTCRFIPGRTVRRMPTET